MIGSKQRKKLFRNNILKIALAVFLFISTAFSCEEQYTDVQADDRVLMAVFAHPDDETLVGPVLHQYANRGTEVILVTATDGRLGFNELHDYDEEELAAVRRDELRCAAGLLGVELIHLDYEDQLGVSGGHGNLISQSRGILRDLHEIIEERQPDAIITFGPDGFSNHMDHRLVGISVTQVVLSRQWEKTPALFYSAVPSSALDEEENIYMGVDDRYLTVQMSFTYEDLEVARKAALCHESQFSPEFVQNWFDTMQERGNVLHFRPFDAAQRTANDFFDYLEQ
jgi:LmbE family N-acetylglucosaminyl deacetylase